MAGPEETIAAQAASEESEYLDGGIDSELNVDFRVDAGFTTNSTHTKKEQGDAAKKENKNKDGVENLKSALIISGVVVAVVGAIFAMVKKIKEARSN